MFEVEIGNANYQLSRMNHKEFIQKQHAKRRAKPVKERIKQHKEHMPKIIDSFIMDNAAEIQKVIFLRKKLRTAIKNKNKEEIIKYKEALPAQTRKLSSIYSYLRDYVNQGKTNLTEKELLNCEIKYYYPFYDKLKFFLYMYSNYTMRYEDDGYGEGHKEIDLVAMLFSKKYLRNLNKSIEVEKLDI